MIIFIIIPISYAESASIQWKNNETIILRAQDMQLEAFLKTIFSKQNIPIQVTSDISAKTLSGKFKGTSESIFSSIKKTFGLHTFYDGQVIYISHAGQSQIKSLSLGTGVAKRAKALIDQLDLTDEHNTMSIMENEEIIILRGTPRFIELCEDLVRPLGSFLQNEPLSVKLFPLKYAWADDITLNFAGKQTIIPGLASTIRALVIGDTSPKTVQERPLKKGEEKLRSKGFRTDEKESLLINSTVSTQTGKLESIGLISSNNAINQVRIEAERRLNAIVVRDTPNRMNYYKELIELLDKEPDMIEIEVQIIDVNIGKSLGLGVNWRLKSSAVDMLFSGVAVPPSDVTLKKLAGFTAATLIGDRLRFAARISALESNGNALIIARPQIMTLGNVEAVLENTSSFYVRLAGTNEVDLFNVSSGTTLRVTPNVLREGDNVRIRMLINIEDGNQTAQTVDQIPVIERVTLNTQALVNEGQSLLIGGMVRESDSKRTSKVPWMGDLPGVGVLFRENQNQTSRVERIFLITPRLIQNKILMKKNSDVSDKEKLLKFELEMKN